MNPDYLKGLTPFQKFMQAKYIRGSQDTYERTGRVEDRPKVSTSKPKRSKHTIAFEDKYGYKVTNLHRVRKDFPYTDIEGILAKGAAAYASSGSRPNVGSFAWKYARLASVLVGHKAYQIDKDLVGPISTKKITTSG
jgi:hypothetical protein